MNYHTRREEAYYIELIPVGDIHIGAPTSKAEQVLKLIKQSGDNARFLFLGDILDNALTHSVSDTYTETCPPQIALTKGFRQLLQAGEGKIIGAVGGNHEERTTRAVGIDLTEIVCNEFSIPYSADILVIDMQVGPKGTKPATYTVVAAHGRGGGRTTGGKINAADRLKDVYPNADVYITGHTHQPSHWKSSYFEIDKRNKMLLGKERYHVIIPAWLGYEHYAANRFYPPSAAADIKIKFGHNHRNKQVKIEVI